MWKGLSKNMRNTIYANRYRITKVFLSILICYLIFSLKAGVFIDERKSNGFSYVTIDNKTVQFYGYYLFYNITPFHKKVELSADSQRDFDTMFISDPKLQLIEVKCEGYSEINELEATVILKPFSKEYIDITAIGNYGGKGKGERHGAKINIIDTSISFSAYKTSVRTVTGQ